MGRLRTVIASLAAAAALAAILPAGAGATSQISAGAGRLTYATSVTEDNNVTIRFENDATPRYLISDTVNLTSGDPDCSVSGTTGSCSAVGVGTIGAGLGGGNDQIQIDSSGADAVPASVESELAGGTEGDVLLGGAGNDRLAGCVDAFTGCSPPSDGADTIDGGSGTDTAIFTDHDGIRVDLNGIADDGENCPGAGCEGDDVEVSVENVVATERADVLIGDNDPNVFDAGSGNDFMQGNLGADVFNGGAVSDTVSYEERSSGSILATIGGDADGANCPGAGCENDNIGAQVENLIGGAGDDVLMGSVLANLLDGRGGDDELAGDAGADTFVGGSNGAGGDEVSYSSVFATDPVVVDLDGVADDGGPTDQTATGSDNVMPDIEVLRGTQFGDALTGTTGPQQLFGGAGADMLDGLAGEDAVAGEAGDDLLALRDGGPDQASCGTESDTVFVDEPGIDTLSDHPPNCETVEFPAAPEPPAPPAPEPPAPEPPSPPPPDPSTPGPRTNCNGLVATVTGTTGADELRATKGNDVIAALAGDDVIRGLGGNDVVCGDEGDDRLVGGAGRDRLLGLGGVDRLAAKDGAADRAIDCGAGRNRKESATVDARGPRGSRDPAPTSC